MMEWVGNNPKFYPHTALHDFEAWLLPYWETIRSLAKHNRSAPSGSPETVNHQKPPSYWIKEIFESGRQSSYDKPIHGAKILKKNELMIAIQACPELKAFVNQIISLCDGSQIIAQDRGLNKTDKLFVGRGARLCAPTENAEVIKFLFLKSQDVKQKANFTPTFLAVARTEAIFRFSYHP